MNRRNQSKAAILAVILSLSVLVLLTGCGQSASNNTEGSSSYDESSMLGDPSTSVEEDALDDSEMFDIYDYCIHSSEALDHVGEKEWVFGTIVNSSAPGSDEDPLYLYMDYDYPDEHRLQILIPGENRDDFIEGLENEIIGEEVAVQGVIEEYKGVAQITLTDPYNLLSEDDFYSFVVEGES